MADALPVRCGDATFSVEPGEQFTFGRSPACRICLDPDDIALSRLAGMLQRDGGSWWVVNASGSRPMAVIDEFGLRSVLPPGRRAVLEGRIRILVEGTAITHELSVDAPVSADATRAEPHDEGAQTLSGDGVLISRPDRAALVALFAGYLEEGARYDPYPKSYAAAAARLGWPRTTLVKRIEYLRARLTTAGVPNLTGWNALANLAEYTLTTGIISRSDLALLHR